VRLQLAVSEQQADRPVRLALVVAEEGWGGGSSPREVIKRMSERSLSPLRRALRGQPQQQQWAGGAGCDAGAEAPRAVRALLPELDAATGGACSGQQGLPSHGVGRATTSGGGEDISLPLPPGAAPGAASAVPSSRRSQAGRAASKQELPTVPAIHVPTRSTSLGQLLAQGTSGASSTRPPLAPSAAAAPTLPRRLTSSGAEAPAAAPAAAAAHSPPSVRPGNAGPKGSSDASPQASAPSSSSSSRRRAPPKQSLSFTANGAASAASSSSSPPAEPLRIQRTMSMEADGSPKAGVLNDVVWAGALLLNKAAPKVLQAASNLTKQAGQALHLDAVGRAAKQGVQGLASMAQAPAHSIARGLRSSSRRGTAERAGAGAPDSGADSANGAEG
jgi:hypothetical protein